MARIYVKENLTDQNFIDLSRGLEAATEPMVEALRFEMSFIKSVSLQEKFWDEVQRKYKLTQGRFLVLLMIHMYREKGLTPTELADMCAISQATITGILKALEKDQLVYRKNHFYDQRKMQLGLTLDGVTVASQVYRLWHGNVAKRWNALQEVEREIVLRVLNSWNT